MKEKKKVVIIGAGPSGLTAAWELVTKAGDIYEVTVLEAADTVGGMAKSVLHNGNIMDVGGHRFYSKEKAVTDWWKAVFQRKEKSSELVLSSRKVSIFYKDRFFDYPITVSLDNVKKLGFLNTLKVGFSYLMSCISPRKEETLEDFYVNRFGKKLYTMFFENYTEQLCGVHPKKVAPEWGMQRVRGLSAGKILKKRFDKKGWQTKEGLLSPSLFYYPKYGPGQLWSAVAEEIAECGGEIRLNQRVVSVHQNKIGKIDFVAVESEQGKERVGGDIFISSMPLNKLVSSMNLVPKDVKKMAEELPYRSLVSVGLVVDSLLTDIQDCWIYVHERGVKVCRIQFYKNWSPCLVEEAEKRQFLALEYYCDEEDEVWSLPDEACMKMAVKEAVKLGILSENVQLFDWHVERVAQAYPGYHGGYKNVEEIRSYLDGVANLFCIGRNGLHGYWNMDRCMISAWEVVKRILRGKTINEPANRYCERGTSEQ